MLWTICLADDEQRAETGRSTIPACLLAEESLKTKRQPIVDAEILTWFLGWRSD